MKRKLARPAFLALALVLAASAIALAVESAPPAADQPLFLAPAPGGACLDGLFLSSAEPALPGPLAVQPPAPRATVCVPGAPCQTNADCGGCTRCGEICLSFSKTCRCPG